MSGPALEGGGEDDDACGGGCGGELGGGLRDDRAALVGVGEFGREGMVVLWLIAWSWWWAPGGRLASKASLCGG